MYHVVVGVLSEKPYDVAVYMLTTIAVWIYSVLNYVNAFEARNTQKLARLIVISTVGPVIIGFSIYLIKKYYQSKAMISAVVGNARPDVQATCNRIFLCDSLLKFDIQLGVRYLFCFNEMKNHMNFLHQCLDSLDPKKFGGRNNC